jgi:hypothetical protein
VCVPPQLVGVYSWLSALFTPDILNIICKDVVAFDFSLSEVGLIKLFQLSP